MAIVTHSGPGQPLSPAQQGDLIRLPLQRDSLALTTSTVLNTDRVSLNVPLLSSDVPSGFVEEAAEIDSGQPEVDTVPLRPRKAAGLAVLSNELINDSDPSATAMIGESIAASLRRTIDTAFLTGSGENVASPGMSHQDPPLTEGEPLDFTNGTTDLDPLSDAINQILAHDGRADVIVMSPATWGHIWRMKQDDGSNVPLLGSPSGPSVAPGQASSPGDRSSTENGGRPALFNVPVFVDSSCPNDTLFTWDSSVIAVAMNTDVNVEFDASARFSSDSTVARGIIRLDWACLDANRAVLVPVTLPNGS